MLIWKKGVSDGSRAADMAGNGPGGRGAVAQGQGGLHAGISSGAAAEAPAVGSEGKQGGSRASTE